MEAYDLTARILQHEIDHLNGILFIDHLPDELRATKQSPSCGRWPRPLEATPLKPTRVVFFGTPGIAVPALEALIGSRHEVVAVVTAPDKPQGPRDEGAALAGQGCGPGGRHTGPAATDPALARGAGGAGRSGGRCCSWWLPTG